ncbi:MAG: hypothetical protein E7Z91_07390 [Cyanobacteria bacterium SIG30]|nr:hypothetical protein [Cyanobacteria bacterium SIG30]
MISKNMYKVLKQIPHAPNKTNFKGLSDKKIIDISFLKSVLREAISYKYIQYCDPSNPFRQVEVHNFYLTEAGQVQIDEYENQKGSSAKATWALVIAGLSFIASVVAIIISVCVVQ